MASGEDIEGSKVRLGEGELNCIMMVESRGVPEASAVHGPRYSDDRLILLSYILNSMLQYQIFIFEYLWLDNSFQNNDLSYFAKSFGSSAQSGALIRFFFDFLAMLVARTTQRIARHGCRRISGLRKYVDIAPEVADALARRAPVVCLEVD